MSKHNRERKTLWKLRLTKRQRRKQADRLLDPLLGRPLTSADGVTIEKATRLLQPATHDEIRQARKQPQGDGH